MMRSRLRSLRKSKCWATAMFEVVEMKVLDWAGDRKILDHSSAQTQLLKTMSELGELADAVIKGDVEGIEDGIGDVLVTLALVAHFHSLDLTTCFESAYHTIKDRTGTLMPNGVFVKDE